MTEQLLQQLNDSQREAVEYCDGAQLVIAGAGSGKTRVLTYKIAYLLQEKGLKPWQILALTFTNKAAREMKERIQRLLQAQAASDANDGSPDSPTPAAWDARSLQMGTFHSIFARILRNEAAKIGFQSNFTIYDQADSRSLVKSIIKEKQLDDKKFKPNTVADRISMAKNHLILPEAFPQSSLFDRKLPEVYDIYKSYVERCRQANAMDFDDLLVQTFLLFKNNEDVRRKYVERFHYVLVDEYQDTNYAQQRIVLQLTQERQRVCVVGDDAQSIYSFRGANIDNILDFRESYDDARLFKLEQNYRSTQLIVQAANSLIRKNERQIPKDVYSRKEEGERVQLKPAYSDKEEAIIVCNDIKRLRRQEHLSFSDFAILYRTNAQSRSFEEQMRKEAIPYRIYGGLSFYQRKEIKDMIAYFRVVANPNDEEALKRIINYPARGIGDTTLNKIVATAATYGVSLWTVITQPVLFHLDIARSTAAKIEAFRQLMEGWMGRMDNEDAYVLGHAIIQESGIAKDIYAGHNPEDVSRQENLQEFLSGMHDFVDGRREEDMGDHVSLVDFLQEVALLTDLDSGGGEDQPKVSLMTIHTAKGLEFPTVFVVGLEENIFPSLLSTDSARALEEERRLLYVAITRAERHCILTCAQMRFRYGRMEQDEPSRFIRDIDPKLLHVEASKEADDDFGTSQLPWKQGRTGGYGQRDSYGQRGGYGQRNEWMQNARPVATQFRADPKPRAVPPRRPEPPVNPFSESFERQLQTASGGRFKPLRSVSPSRPVSSSVAGDLPLDLRSLATKGTQESPPPSSAPGNLPLDLRSLATKGTQESPLPSLREGNVIEHQRFGIGTVVKMEGTGENEKATVDFRNAGTRQLLLKFAKYTILK